MAWPLRRQKLTRLLRARLAKAASHAGRWLRPARPAVANLAKIPLTVAGFGCLDAAAFAWRPIVGLAGAGVLLIVLEHLIADEE